MTVALATALASTVALTATTAPTAHADTTATAPRVPELVSPSDKNGNDVMAALRNTPDGSTVAFLSLGAFAGTPGNALYSIYRSTRTANGWTTAGSLSAPTAAPAPSLNDALFPTDLSDDLATAYYSPSGATSFAEQDQNTAGDVFSVTGGQATWLSPALTLPDTDVDPNNQQNSVYAGRSADGRHIVIESSKQLIPSVAGGTTRVYERVDGALRLVSVPPSTGTPPATEEAHFGGDRASTGTYIPGDARAISTDGSRIYFGMDGQLYVRIDGTTTQLISADRETGHPRAAIAGANAVFMGASADGRRVLFTSDAPLTDGASGQGLYLYDAQDDSLRELADAGTGSPAPSILGTFKTTADGARTFFVSDAALTSGATAGSPNLYVAGDVPLRLVATLASTDGPFNAGEYGNQAALSPDGNRLAFRSSNDITNNGNTGGRTQLYEYDVTHDTVICASCPPPGVTPSSDADLRDVPGNQQVTPAGFADDGTLFFETKDPLTPDDTDALYDVYAYDGAGVHLLSPNTPDDDVLIAGSSSDGRDVFVRTHATLSAADHDGGLADIYDLRIGGGFPSTPGSCEAEACRGAQSPPPPPPPGVGSLTATDTSTPARFTPASTTFKVSSISAAARRTWARTGRVTLTVRVSEDAEVTAKATAHLRGAKKVATIASRTGQRVGPGAVKLALTLSSSARSALKRSHKLTVKLSVTCTDAKKAAHATVVLRTNGGHR